MKEKSDPKGHFFYALYFATLQAHNIPNYGQHANFH